MLALVTTDGGPFFVGDAAADDVDDDENAALPFESESEFEVELESELDSELELWLATLLFTPVSWTDQELGPPPVTQSATSKTAVLAATYMYPSCTHNILSCTQNLRLCCSTPEADHHTSN